MTGDNQSNPYAAPVSKGKRVERPTPAGMGVNFVPIVRRWERLRIYYNGILVSLVLLLVLSFVPHHFVDPSFWLWVVFGALFSNLCFFLGPSLEGYGTYARLWNNVLTGLLFLVGLGLTMLLAVFFVLLY